MSINLLAKETLKNTITLGDKVRISDPCYDMDTWCAGTLQDVLPGTYKCFMQKSDQGSWGIRVANIEVRHSDYLKVEPTEICNIDVGVDSGQCGIYDLDYFKREKNDEEKSNVWYTAVCNKTCKQIHNPKFKSFKDSEFWKDEFDVYDKAKDYLQCSLTTDMLLLTSIANIENLTDEQRVILEQKKKQLEDDSFKEYLDAKLLYNQKYDNTYPVKWEFTADTMDNKCLVSSSGDGDGSYTCLVGRNKDGKIVSIKIHYYYYEDEEEEDDWEDDEYGDC